MGLALVPLAASQRAAGKSSWIEDLPLRGRVTESIKLFTVGVFGPLVLFATVLAALLVAGVVVLVLRRGNERERGGA